MNRMVLMGAKGSVLSFDLYLFGTEVDEESLFHAGGREVVDELDFVGLDEAGDGFELDNQAFFDQKISHEIANDDAIVTDLNGLLGRGGDAFSIKLNHETLFVDRLEEAKTQRVVNLVRAADHFFGELRHILFILSECFFGRMYRGDRLRQDIVKDLFKLSPLVVSSQHPGASKVRHKRGSAVTLKPRLSDPRCPFSVAE